jgi:DNA-directed RNA polymerase subunit H (RpoH/RPB5)
MVNTNSSVLISQIYQSRKIVLQLMNRQGYDTSCYSNFSVSEINAMKQNNQLDILLESKVPATGEKIADGKKVYIRYYLAKTIRPTNVNEMIDDLFVLSETLKKTDTLYIIIKDNVNETLINELKHIWERDGIFIIIESIKYLQFNILNHVLVPEHNIITDSEVINVMTKYNITDKIQFPDISRFDPVARAIGLRPGQVCNIIRPSKTAIKTNYYRICI